MFKRVFFLGALTLLLACCCFALRVSLEQQALAGRLIRLHVVAASDDPADQARKLRVRDALLPRIEALTAACHDARSAETALRAGLPELERLAAETLATGEPVRASLERERFPRRDYDSFSLPAGVYRALRITLGRGEGHNWWCVAFPALCLPASEDFREAALSAGLFPEQIELMQPERSGVQIKFRLLEWLSEAFAP